MVSAVYTADGSASVTAMLRIFRCSFVVNACTEQVCGEIRFDGAVKCSERPFSRHLHQTQRARGGPHGIKLCCTNEH